MDLHKRDDVSPHTRVHTATRYGQQNTPPAATRQASPPRPPGLSGTVATKEDAYQAELKKRENHERRSMFRGLILLAILVLLFAVVRAGMGRAFPSGWWHRW